MRILTFLIPGAISACAPGFCSQVRCSLHEHLDTDVPLQGSTCIASTPGSLCAECNHQGYLVNSTCICVLPYADPLQNCTQVVSYASVHTVTAQASQVTCTAFQNTAEGFYVQPSYDETTYGDPNPPLPDACLNAAWGPQPNVLADSLLTGVPIATCNTLGGPDPNLVASANDSSFATCSSHGLWNIAPVYRCSCYTGWGLQDTGIPTFSGETGEFSHGRGAD